MMIPKKEEKNQLPKYLALMGVAAQMGVTIYVAAYFGKILDEKYPNEKNYYTIALTLLGIAVAMFLVIKQLNRLSK